MSVRMTGREEFERYLEKVWTDRINLPVQSSAHDAFQSRVTLLRYELAEGEDERKRLRAFVQELNGALAQEREAVRAAQEQLQELNGALAQEREAVRAAQEQLYSLANILTVNLSRPWLPLRDWAYRRLALLAAGMVRPFSERRAERFKKSAKKRNPRRYQFSSSTVFVGSAISRLSEERRIEVPDEYDAQTRKIIERYFPHGYKEPPPPLHIQVGSAELVRDLLNAAPESLAPPLKDSPAFSIITPFFAHVNFFEECANSVAALAVQTSQRFEWIIVNDDPAVADEQLLARIPTTIKACTRIISDGQNRGIALALDRGIAEAAYPWIVLLDCDDMLEPNALDVLASAINNSPRCRYFSSLMIDIDEHGRELRRRRGEADLTRLFEAGMIAGHMIAFRRDLYKEVGGFDPRFSGVQDFDLALRIASREKIQRIPQHLYRYRWHMSSQSVSRQDRQARLTNAVRVAFLRETVGFRHESSTRSPLPERPEIFCVIRTQGNRMDLLCSALKSVRAQVIPTTPCIVVHGDNEILRFVREHLPPKLGEAHTERPAIILHANKTNLRRGYPCNVALDFLKAHAKQYHLLCFLDDDDHFLPTFAERLTQLMRLSGADLTYGMANALPKDGEPLVQHQLRPWLTVLAGNFIPFNSFLVRVDAVIEAGAVFEEDMDYLEDHHFLIQLVGAGLRGAPLAEVVSEYRLIGDGNADIKRDMDHFTDCQNRVRKKAKEAARALSQAAFWNDILDFPTRERGPFDERELAHILEVRDLLKS